MLHNGISERINKKIPQPVYTVLNKLHESGFPSYLVGGCVRDLLLGRTPTDYDICTGAKPEQVRDMFERVFDTGIKFGTVTVIMSGHHIEVTTFRKGVTGKVEISEAGHRKAISSFGSSDEEDVRSRDFTINALLFDGKQIIDYVDGQKDLNKRVIRAIGEPEARFHEDALRLMRAIRLGCQLDFTVEEKTYQSIWENASLIENSAKERVRDELIKIIVSDCPSKGIRQLQKTGLLKHVLPELEDCFGFNQHNPHHDKDIFDHIMAVVENVSPEATVRLAALLHDIGKPKTFFIDDKGIGHFYSHNMVGMKMAKRILRDLKMPKKTVADVSILVKEHMNKLTVFKKSTVKKLINRVGEENVHKLMELQKADILGSAPPHEMEHIIKLEAIIEEIMNEEEPLTVQDLAVNGDDLKEMGIEPGPKMGQILQGLLEKVMEDPGLNNKEQLIKLTRKLLVKGWF